jgi:hypothetical protein
LTAAATLFAVDRKKLWPSATIFGVFTIVNICLRIGAPQCGMSNVATILARQWRLFVVDNKKFWPWGGRKSLWLTDRNASS